MRILLAAAARSTNTRSFVEPFARRGHDVHVATLHPGPIATATVHDLGRSERGLSRVAFLRAVPAFLGLHRRLRPDLTIGYYASSYGLLAAVAPRPRVVVTAGGDVLRDALDSALRTLLVPRLAGFAVRRADLVLCWGRHLADAVRDLGVDASRILILPRGIDVALFRPATEPVSGPPTIVSTRTLSAFYRPEILFDAFLEIRQSGIAARLEMIGEGPLAGLLGRRALADETRSIRMEGRLEPADLAERLRGCSIYASFPPSEGVSASLLESLASGLVPVVGDLPANRDWVENGVNGLLVPEPLTVAAVADALRRAVLDVDLRRRARTLNPEKVHERADRDRNVERFESAFADLVSRTSRAP